LWLKEPVLTIIFAIADHGMTVRRGPHVMQQGDRLYNLLSSDARAMFFDRATSVMINEYDNNRFIIY
jgi:hypothetical protein